MTEHKTDMNITKNEKYKEKKRNEWHFYEAAQNRHEYHWKTEQLLLEEIQNRHERYWKTEHDGTQNRTQLHLGETNNKYMQIKQTLKFPTKMFNENIQSTANKYALFISVTEKLEERKTHIIIK